MLNQIQSNLFTRWELAQKQQIINQLNKKGRLKGDWKSVIISRHHHASAIIRKITEYRKLTDETKILEVGSGAHGTSFFHTQGTRVGLDPLASFYRKEYHDLQKHSTAHICSGMGESLPFKSAIFDVVISDNVLDHTASPHRVVSEIRRVLNKDGLFYLAVNLHHFTYRLFNLAFVFLYNLRMTPNTPYYKAHTYFFTPKLIRKILNCAPFEILYSDIPLLIKGNEYAITKIRSTKNIYCTLVCAKN